LEKFQSALKGKAIEVTKANFKELSALCDEFGFELESPPYRLARLETGLEELQRQIAEQLSTEVRELRREVSALKTEIAVLKGWSAAPDSQILFDLPDIFAEFKMKRFSLLWRGGRDGFGAQEFHRRCNRRANTLTVILDTEGNIFGGFTPVEWDSRRSSYWKADDSQRSFLFTLKNPRNIPARRFALKAEKKWRAIRCDSGWGPRFGYGDISVCDNCNANTDSFASLGSSYTNDTGLDRGIFFTGSRYFQVKEIEVFAITG
jgi:hypothetical protein